MSQECFPKPDSFPFGPDEHSFWARRVREVTTVGGMLTAAQVNQLSEVGGDSVQREKIQDTLCDASGIRPLDMSVRAAGLVTLLLAKDTGGQWCRNTDAYTAFGISPADDDSVETIRMEAEWVLQQRERERQGSDHGGPWIVSPYEQDGQGAAKTMNGFLAERYKREKLAASVRDVLSSKFVLLDDDPGGMSDLILPDIPQRVFLAQHPNIQIHQEAKALLSRLRIYGGGGERVCAAHAISGIYRQALVAAYLFPDGIKQSVLKRILAHSWGSDETEIVNRICANQGSILTMHTDHTDVWLETREGEKDERSYWQKSQDSLYELTGKEHFEQRMKRLSGEGKLGERVMDVGCGPYPVTDVLDQKKHHRFLVDWIPWETSARPDDTVVTVNVRDVAAVHQSLQEAPPMDSMVFSSLLNYVDYQSTLSVFRPYLKPGGRYIIFNKPDFGMRNVLHARRPRSTREVVECLMFLEFTPEEVINVQHSPQNDCPPADRDAHVIIARRNDFPD